VDDVFGQIMFAEGDEDLGALMRYLPACSPSVIGAAVERSAPTSDPACGSVRFIVPDHSPEISLAR
jgi:hypothetical protein